MSDFVALHPSMPKRPANRTRFSLGRMFGSMLEALVAASARNFAGHEQTFYRYPPI